MLLAPYFREKALLIFVNEEYYSIALDCQEVNLLLKLLFAALCQRCDAGETDVLS